MHDFKFKQKYLKALNANSFILIMNHRLYHDKAARLVYRYHMQRKHTVPKMRSETKTANPHCTGSRY